MRLTPEQKELRRKGLESIAKLEVWEAAHPESTKSESARQAKRGYKMRQALANGTYARRLRRQARDQSDLAHIRRWLKTNAATATDAPSVSEVARVLHCSLKRARRLYVAAGGVVRAPGRRPVARDMRDVREEQAG